MTTQKAAEGEWLPAILSPDYDDEAQHPRPRQLPVSMTTEKLEAYRSNHKKEIESGSHIRMSNSVIGAMLQISPTAWRFWTTAISAMDVYPPELITDESFLKKFAEGRTTIPPKFRTVKLDAKTYQNDWGIPANNSGRTFTLDALELWETTLSSTKSFDPKRGEATISLNRAISTLELHVKSSPTNTLSFQPEQVKRDLADKRKDTIWQCSSVTMVVDENVAHNMFLMAQYFTRLEKPPARYLSKRALKVYTLLAMYSGQSAKNQFGGWDFSLSLDECNDLLGVDSKSIPYMQRNLKSYVDEINRATGYDLLISPCERTKEGKRLTHLIFSFGLKTQLEAIECTKEITRRLVNRPRCAVGSHAEGEWARKNIEILLKYEKDLKAVKRILPKVDRDRLARYRAIIGER